MSRLFLRKDKPLLPKLSWSLVLSPPASFYQEPGFFRFLRLSEGPPLRSLAGDPLLSHLLLSC